MHPIDDPRIRPLRPRLLPRYWQGMIAGMAFCFVCGCVAGQRMSDNHPASRSTSGTISGAEGASLNTTSNGAALAAASAVAADLPPSDSPPVEAVTTKLIETCDAIAISHGGCGDLDKPVWSRFESVTGEVTKLDTASIQPGPNGGAFAIVYTYLPGTPFDARRVSQIYFSCHGQYVDTALSGIGIDAPPRSVIGTIATVACAKALPMAQALEEKGRQEDREAEMHPRPEDYCQGFTAESCAQIQAGVEAHDAPTYCGPGFGLPEKGLSPEQIRICFARPHGHN